MRGLAAGAMLVLAGIAGGICCGSGEPRIAEAAELLPSILQGQTFIYDELETGEGTVLYTLVFTEDGYKLYNDNGVGIISSGEVETSDGKNLIFMEELGDEMEPAEEADTEEDGKAESGTTPEGSINAKPDTNCSQFYGSYTGSAFEEPSVTLEYDGRTMEFAPDTESGEYVYLSYLGVFEGEIREKPAVLILDRWLEFYLYTDGTLVRGTYEIYEDGTVEFVTADQETFRGTVEKGGEDSFDIKETCFTLGFLWEELAAENVVFSWADAEASYDAEHAMGTYTLSVYDADVFVIRGVDGLVKAMGTIEFMEDGGRVIYFPRSITGEAELDEKFTVEFTCEEDNLIFPASTYLLPRSGNIDKDTGYGSYWSAGTTLEFIKNVEVEQENFITYEVQETDGKEAPIEKAVESGMGELRQTMPSLGTAKPLVLLIDFPDYKRPRFITAEGIEEALFDLENPDSLSAYYFRSSYGNLTIDGTVLDWYRMEKNREDYESDKEIMEEVLNYYMQEEGLELSEYDADGDGSVDSLYVLWSGTLENSGSWSAAYRSSWKDSPEEWGTKVGGYIFVPGNTVWSSVPPLVCNVNSLTHETGHLLGLNDYYSYDTTDRTDSDEPYTGGALEGGLGGMDMMDANIADHNAFSKWLLGWCEPQMVEFEDIASLETEEQVYTLRPSNEQGDAIFVKLKSSDSLYTELLVIEVVSATGNAGELTRLKEPVVRILHVDASLDEEGLEGNWRGFGFKYDNSYTSTKFISVLEADGKDEVLNYLPEVSGKRISYDPEDYFLAGDQITPNTYPNTNGYDAYGNATLGNGLTITVESISETGEAVIRLGYEEPQETLAICSITPEPVIVPEEVTDTAMAAETTDVNTAIGEEKGPTAETIVTEAAQETVTTEEAEAAQETVTTEEAEKTEETEGSCAITIRFDREIAEAGAGSLSEILVASGNQPVTGYHVEVLETELKLVFEEPLENGRDYTVVIPAGIVQSAENENVTNNYNSIFGFVGGEFQNEK